MRFLFLHNYDFGSEDSKPPFNLLFEVDVLIFLFPYDLTTLLAAAHEVGHHLLSRPEWYILEDFQPSVCQIVSHVVRKALQLSKQHAVLTVVIRCEANRLLDRINVVGGDKQRVCRLHL